MSLAVCTGGGVRSLCDSVLCEHQLNFEVHRDALQREVQTIERAQL